MPKPKTKDLTRRVTETTTQRVTMQQLRRFAHILAAVILD